MKNFLGFLVLFLMFSCSQFVDKPKNLLSKSKMAELIAEMSLNEESIQINPTGNLEAGTRFILKQHKIQAEDFNESYKYYAVSKKLEPILNEAQEIIKKKHPEAEKFIEKSSNENQNLPPLSR